MSASPAAGAATSSAAWRFAWRFAILGLLLLGGFEAARDTETGRFVIDGLILAPTASLAHWLTPGLEVDAIDRVLEAPGVRLRVLPGCEGIETILLLAAAILAYPAPPRARALALVGGTTLAYLLSLARLLVLFYSLRGSRPLFDSIHGLVAPLLPIVVLAGYFMAWAGRQQARAQTGHAQ